MDQQTVNTVLQPELLVQEPEVINIQQRRGLKRKKVLEPSLQDRRLISSEETEIPSTSVKLEFVEVGTSLQESDCDLYKIQAVRGLSNEVEPSHGLSNLVKPSQDFHNLVRQHQEFSNLVNPPSGLSKLVKQHQEFSDLVNPLSGLSNLVKHQDLSKKLELHKLVTQRKGLSNNMESYHGLSNIKQDPLSHEHVDLDCVKEESFHFAPNEMEHGYVYDLEVEQGNETEFLNESPLEEEQHETNTLENDIKITSVVSLSESDYNSMEMENEHVVCLKCKQILESTSSSHDCNKTDFNRTECNCRQTGCTICKEIVNSYNIATPEQSIHSSTSKMEKPSDFKRKKTIDPDKYSSNFINLQSDEKSIHYSTVSSNIETPSDFKRIDPDNYSIETANNLPSEIMKVEISNNSGKKRNIPQELYNHICTYHIKYDNNNDENNIIIALSLLVNVFNIDCKRSIRNSYLCLECGGFNSRKGQFLDHCATIHGYQSTELIQCKVCSKYTGDLEKMEMHLKQEHDLFWNYRVNEDSVYNCSMCEDLFSVCDGFCSDISFKSIKLYRLSKLNFKYKILNPAELHAHNSLNYCCEICKPRIVIHSQPELHLKFTHRTDYVFRTCSTCGNECYNMNDYYNHLKNGICSSTEFNFENFQTKSDTITCEKCSISFDNHCSLEIHILVSHNFRQLNTKLANGNLFVCPVCKVTFSNVTLFYAHCTPYSILSSKHGNSKCSILVKKSTKRQESWKCTLCDVSFSSTSQLDPHISHAHYTQFIHCTLCNVNVVKSSNISHFKELCIESRSQIKRSSNLQFCPICGLRFESFDVLINHINIDLKLLPVKKFQCKYCLNYFYTQYNLCAHLVSRNCISFKISNTIFLGY